MPKSIWFPDEEFEQLVTLARQAGFRVSRGRGSQLRLFVMAVANTASTGIAVGSDKPELAASDNQSVAEAGSPALR